MEGSPVIEERKAKALFAGGLALFVTGLVVLMLFVIPAARQTQVAVAQEEEMPPGGEEGAYPGPSYPGPAGEMDPAMMGEPGREGGAAPPAAPAIVSDPLEPSRPNPFAPRSSAAIAAAAVGDGAGITTYGPDWSKLPIAERVGFVLPEIPDAPTPPVPVIQRAGDVEIRITSILWDASGQAIAAYEGPEGRSGQIKPGDRIEGYTVTEITRSGVTLQHPRTGEVQTLELRPRTERQEEPRPRRPRATGGQRGGAAAGGGRTRPQGGFPAAPPN